ncbi:MAG: hypothetical protein LBV58_02755 [Acholeplasmatales bacterium]|jgi:hypothetical protein|nr:hypothetical protein [Acholeplasmatales bacterium]
MKKNYVLIVLLLFVTVCLSAMFLKNDSEPVTRNLNADSSRKESLSYLNSFDEVQLDISEFDSTFIASKKVNSLSGVELLNTTLEQISEYSISFDATYVQEVGIVFFKINLNNSTSSVDEIDLVGFPFYNETIDQVDISFEYFGEIILASDLLYKSVDEQAASNKVYLLLTDNGGGVDNPPVVNVTMPILQISIAIVNSGSDLIQEAINQLIVLNLVDFGVMVLFNTFSGILKCI